MQTEYIDTISDMCSDDYKVRYKAEYKQLCIRIDRLVSSLKHYDGPKKGIELALKERQLIAMIQYKNILELRADIENIPL